MTNPSPVPREGGKEQDGRPADPLAYPGVPRWVKVFGVVAIVLIVLGVIVHFTGIAGHHAPSHVPFVGGHGRASSP